MTCDQLAFTYADDVNVFVVSQQGALLYDELIGG